MGRAVKVAISLPCELLEEAERSRQARGETRSAFFRHVLEAYLRREREREDVERYIRAYEEQPETEEEIAEARAIASSALGREPWE